MRFVDSHLHLDGPDATDTVAWAKSAGVAVFGCGTDERNSKSLLILAHGLDGTVFPFVGVHPSEAEKSEGLSWLPEAAKEAAGIGEIGLDPTYSPAGEGSPQMRAFRGQLEVAEKWGKPVQVHSRSAEAKCLEVLGQSRVKRVLMHRLESEEAVPKAMERGYFVSFGPALLYSRRVQRAAMKSLPELTLLETDSPVPYAPLGGAKGPALVPSVAFRLAELRGAPFGETLEGCSNNALRFLGGGKG
ncbi:MAG: TatD family hydrolase [Nitrososphaerota archaeon]|nr:TatD family hydrolase [Nitrososphaerota archaeon]